jgi:hypothetical protein
MKMNASEVEELQKEIEATMERLLPDKHFFIGISISDGQEFRSVSVTNIKEESPYYLVRGLVRSFIQLAEQLQIAYLGKG